MTVLLPVSEINWISVENVMKTCRLYDALLAWRILLWGKVYLSIQLPIPCGLHELKRKQKCVCAYVSAPASVCDPQRLCNPVLLMLSRVLLSITESSNQSGGLEQLTEAGLSSQTDIVCPLSSCSVSDSVCVCMCICVCVHLASLEHSLFLGIAELKCEAVKPHKPKSIHSSFIHLNHPWIVYKSAETSSLKAFKTTLMCKSFNSISQKLCEHIACC